MINSERPAGEVCLQGAELQNKVIQLAFDNPLVEKQGSPAGQRFMSAHQIESLNRLDGVAKPCPDCKQEIHPNELIRLDTRLIQCPDCKFVFNEQSELRTDILNIPAHAETIRLTRR